MVQGRKTIEELIAEEQKKAEESKARMMALLARKKTQDRKTDTRRKILVGYAALAYARRNPAFDEHLKKAVPAEITRVQDKLVLPEFFPTPVTREARTAPPEKHVDPPDRPRVGPGHSTNSPRPS